MTDYRTERLKHQKLTLLGGWQKSARYTLLLLDAGWQALKSLMHSKSPYYYDFCKLFMIK